MTHDFVSICKYSAWALVGDRTVGQNEIEADQKILITIRRLIWLLLIVY